MQDYKYIVTSHNRPNLSGVAKFNHVLARKFGIECVPMERIGEIANARCLLSVKIKDCSETEQNQLSENIKTCVSKGVLVDLFFHTFDGLGAEATLLKYARSIFCGNEEIADKIKAMSYRAVALWCPALIEGGSSLHQKSLNLFSFGMAHKIQQASYRRLYETLEHLGASFNLRVSTAFHERANFGDFDSVSSELQSVFGDKLSFLGFLSDASVNFFLESSDLFVAFFDGGVRANNTSIYAAMAKNCPVLTNLDQWSPKWLEHGENILDIGRLTTCDLKSENLQRIGNNGKQGSVKNSSWDALTQELKNFRHNSITS